VRVAILSYGAWVDRFGGRPDIVGSTLTFNDAPYTVVGVLPGNVESSRSRAAPDRRARSTS
jgi:hypothetical protein